MSNRKIIKCRVTSGSTFTDLIGYYLQVTRDKAFYRIVDVEFNTDYKNNVLSELNKLKDKYIEFCIGREQLEFIPPYCSTDLMSEEHIKAKTELFSNKGAYSPIGEVDTSNPPGTRVYGSGAKRDGDINKPYVHNLMAYTRLRFGYLTREGARKYGDGNFLKGFPDENAIQSLERHLAMYLNGDRSEDHLSSIIFNAQLLMLNEQKAGIKPDNWFKYEQNG